MFTENLENKNFCLLGISKITLKLLDIFNKNRINYCLIDNDNDRLDYCLINKKIVSDSVVKIEGCNFKNIDTIILSEGIFFDEINDENLKFVLNNYKDKIITEIEFIDILFQNKDKIAVFGRNEKYFITEYCYNILTKYNLSFISYLLDEDKLNLEDKTIISFLDNRKINYLKNIKFNTIILSDSTNLENYDIIFNDEIRTINSNLIVNIDDDGLKDFLEKNMDKLKGLYNNIYCISTNKILNDGYSLVNDYIYDYYNGHNLSYSLQDTIFKAKGSIQNLSIILSFILIKNVLLSNSVEYSDIELIDKIKEINKNIKNFLNESADTEKYLVLNNLYADTERLIKEPYEIYNDIFTIIIVDNYFDVKKNNFFFEKSKKVYIYNNNYKELKLKTNKNLFVSKNFNELFEKVKLDLKKEDDKINIIITHNIDCGYLKKILYNDCINKIKNVFGDTNEQ